MRMERKAGAGSGDVCVVDFDALDEGRPMPYQQRRILVDVIRQGHGKVQVESVRGDTAHVFSHGNPMSRIVGGVDVPVAALEVLRAASSRMAELARRVVASEVTDEMVRQVRFFLRKIVLAAERAFPTLEGGRSRKFAPWPTKKEDEQTIVVNLKSVGLEDDVAAGFRLKYDYGSDTYEFTPFAVFGTRVKWGRESSEFYVEDLGDVSKMKHLFETALP